jgi:hypothetical protein
MPVLTNLKFNPNKVYSANVNHLKELQLIKQREADLKIQSSFQGYPQMYPMAAPNYYYPYQMQQIVWQEPVQMPYYPNMYSGVQSQYYSPPMSSPFYPTPVQNFSQEIKKPTAKLSTKSPHAILGHKLTRRNTTSYVPGHASLLGKVETKCQEQDLQVTKNATFSPQAQNDQDDLEFKYLDSGYFRKSTMDETNYFNHQSVSPISSPEEHNMWMRIMASFKLNPYPVENDEEQEIEVANADENEHYSQAVNPQGENDDDDYMFNVFNTYEAPSFQKEGAVNSSSSSGPIFSLLLKSDAKGTSN